MRSHHRDRRATGAGRAPAAAGIAALAAFLLAACSAGNTLATDGTPSGGSSSIVGVTTWRSGARPGLDSIAGVTLGGARLAVSSLRGRVVVLNMWASWCYPCRTEVPALASVARATESRGVTFVGVDEQDSDSAARKFIAADHVPFVSIVDADGHLLAALGLVPPDAIPSTLILDRTGHVAARVVGPVTAKELRSLLATLDSPA